MRCVVGRQRLSKTLHTIYDELGRPRKQRHTAKRVFDRLRVEHGFTGGYTIVKD